MSCLKLRTEGKQRVTQFSVNGVNRQEKGEDMEEKEEEEDVWLSWIWRLNHMNHLEYSYHAYQTLEAQGRDRGMERTGRGHGREGQEAHNLIPFKAKYYRFRRIWSSINLMAGNKKLKKAKFADAVAFYQKAIELNPRDHRLFVNRAIALERMGKLELALIDAKRSVALNIFDPKTHFRLARVYHCLRLYFDADSAFAEALKIGFSFETYREMIANRVKAIVSMGFDHLDATNAAKLYDTLLEALEYLDLKKSSISIEERFVMSLSNGDPTLRDPKEHLEAIRSKWRPNNVFQSKGITVFNPLTQVKHDLLNAVFSKYGVIVNIRYTICGPYKTVQVNFDNINSPVDAICELQGSLETGLCTEGIVLRFAPVPRQSTVARLSLCRILNVCYYWRTSGCRFAGICQCPHSRANKGIDWDPVLSPKGKGTSVSGRK